ncbi:glycoside hydrolase [Auriculariales sp. MPI-PUGE-AT-0066]|nr:glycoside hydrolase [Auriculariales sp. MPI-PUGE-AT-0066]
MELHDATSASVQVKFRPALQHTSGTLRVPVVQGMGFVTAIYDDLTPQILSGVGFQSLTLVKTERNDIIKYRLTLLDLSCWLLYIQPRHAQVVGLARSPENDHCLQISTKFSGLIQVAKRPSYSCEDVYDRCAGAYATDIRFGGSLVGHEGRLHFDFQRGDSMQGRPLLMFALPHHLTTFDDPTARGILPHFQLTSTTKGFMTAVLGNRWSMVENDIPRHLTESFFHRAPMDCVTDEQRQLILDAAKQELEENLEATSDLDSLYFSGKALDRFAQLCHTLWKYDRGHDMLEIALRKLKSAFERFAQNRQKFPLVYDQIWGGVTSSAAFVTGDVLADFGNSLYNDHHFHASYFVHAAAIIALVDGSLGRHTWLAENKGFITTLLRDAANPSISDPYFPFSRAFDWFSGHSWAKGLFESWDGKDEESSSEDVHFAYGQMLFGAVSNDSATAARGALQLAVLRRACAAYMHMRADNPHHPAQFAANRVSGILFEGKVDHTTYFGANIEFIHGIHMLPVTPASAYARNRDWCREEWETWFSDGRAERIEGGWRGVVMASRIAWDVRGVAQWFFNDQFDRRYLDDGMSLAYYRALTAEELGRQSSNR